jgi:TonB family protein
VGEDRVVARLVLPPPAVLRPRAAPVPPPPPALPAGHAPPPPAPRAKDKISIGPPSLARAKEIWLRKDEDIPKEAQGNGALGPQEKALPGPAATAAPTAEPTAAAVARVGRGDRPLAPADAGGPSITRSLQRLEETLHQQGGAGLGLGPTGPKSVDGLEYDPEGADFTDWINHLKRELYRNWIVPQAAMMGFRGHVTVGFAVARDGHLVEGEILSPSGTISLDHAAKNAVLGSRMLPLPSDYAPNVFRIRVTFYYNEGPRSS